MICIVEFGDHCAIETYRENKEWRNKYVERK